MTKIKPSSTPKALRRKQQNTKTAAPTQTQQPAQPAAPERPKGITGKLGQVASAVSAEQGATIDELIATTGWQPHTVRAALARLRPRGVDARLTTVDDRKAYRVADGAEA